LKHFILEIKVKYNRRGTQEWTMQETQATLDRRHSRQTNKTNKNISQNDEKHGVHEIKTEVILGARE
jgi:hypothetical protein